MRLGSLAALGVSGLPDRVWELRNDGGEAARLVVVTGPSGAGKSQWLRAVAAHKEGVAAYGSIGWLSGTVHRERPRCKTNATWTLSEDEQRYGGFPEPVTFSEVIIEKGGGTTLTADPGLMALLDRWDPTVSLGRMISIPPVRVPLPFPSGASDVLLEQRMTALADDTTKLASAIAQAKRALRAGVEDARLEMARQLVERFDVGARIAGITADGELEIALRGGDRIGLSRASTSQVQAVATAAFFAFARLRNGIVLYDTPEAGLPPGAALAWLEALRDAEPTNQWIVATHDPSLLAITDARGVELEGAA